MKAVNFANLKKIRKMTLNQFNEWLMIIYESGVQDGVDQCEEGVISELDEDELMDILLSVKGIGEKRAREAVEKIVGAGRYEIVRSK